MISYKIDYDFLYEKVDELVSQTAAREYSEDGTSLYDSVKIPSNEKQRVVGFVHSGVSSLIQRLADVADIDPDVADTIVFHVPDFNTAFEERVTSQITIYLVNYACALWMDRVDKDKVELFLGIAKGAMDTAAVLAKTRRKPTRKTATEETTDTEEEVTNENTEEDTDDDDNA